MAANASWVPTDHLPHCHPRSLISCCSGLQQKLSNYHGFFGHLQVVINFSIHFSTTETISPCYDGAICTYSSKGQIRGRKCLNILQLICNCAGVATITTISPGNHLRNHDWVIHWCWQIWLEKKRQKCLDLNFILAKSETSQCFKSQ